MEGQMEIEAKVEKIIGDAVHKNANDLFFLVVGEQYHLLLRTNDLLRKYEVYSIEEGQRIITALKFKAQMDIAEHRRPQVGALEHELAGKKYYLRLSSVGDYQGQESLVVRIIYELSAAKYFYPADFKKLEQLTKKRGLILTSGPTGSGKTTLMYELARKISSDRIVMCLEDPVEINEPDFLQTQVNLAAGIDYPALLKAALRHRPDVLIVGEIRDATTAKLAVQASLSGHLVIATVHAKSSKGTIMRLLQLGLSVNDLENSLTAITYQRLMPDNFFDDTCLFDIGSGHELMQAISQPTQGFFSWREKLADLEKRGVIDDKTWAQFQEG